MREEDVGSEIRLAVAKPRDEGRVGLEVELEAEDEGLGGDVVKGAALKAIRFAESLARARDCK